MHKSGGGEKRRYQSVAENNEQAYCNTEEKRSVTALAPKTLIVSYQGRDNIYFDFGRIDARSRSLAKISSNNRRLKDHKFDCGRVKDEKLFGGKGPAWTA